jgi:hypothetical protein
MRAPRDVFGGKADDLAVAANRGTRRKGSERDFVASRDQPRDDEGAVRGQETQARRERLQRNRYRIRWVEVYGHIGQKGSAGSCRLKGDGSVCHGWRSGSLLASGMQRRWLLAIVLGIFAIIALFVASALLPPMFLAVALMVVVLLAFVAVGLMWRGE